MKSRENQRKSLKLSLALHGSALVLMVAMPWVVKGCARNKPNEKLMFVEFTVSIPPPPAPDVPESPAPEPPKLDSKDDVPIPDKKPDPEPPKPPKKDIRQTNVVTRKDFKAPPPKDKPLSAAEIEAALKKGARLSDRTSIPARDDQLARAAYHNHVRDRMYTAWQQPPQLKSLPGLSADVRITVAPDGRITARVKTRGSGNELMDDSVMKAVNSVKALRALPAINKSPIDIEICFELGQ